jgi:hypothetical protein
MGTAARTAARIERVLRRAGRYLDEHGTGDEHDELCAHHPVLAACYRAATSGRQLLGDHPGAPLLRLLSTPAKSRHTTVTLVAEVRGFNVHSQRVVDGRDRRQLERLCRYLARPPLSHDRLSALPDGRLRLALKSPWSDGTAAVMLHPLDLIARLCALVPPPAFHLTRYAGVLASHSALRSEIIYKGRADPELLQPQLSLFDNSGLGPAPPAEPDPAPPSGRKPWAWLLRRVFAVDISVCPHCQGPMKLTQVALTTDAIARVRARNGLGPQPPPPPTAAPPPGQLGLCFGA